MTRIAIIPARGGSKGLPGKNIKELDGIPLIWYSLAFALHHFPKDCIWVSTDDTKIKEQVQRFGLNVPSLRPAELAGDKVGMSDVLLYTIEEWTKHSGANQLPTEVLLLQPTSPFRRNQDLLFMIEQMRLPNTDMVVSVMSSKANPYFTLFQEDSMGYIHRMLEGEYHSRQELPQFYQLNGSMYLFNVASFIEKGSLSKLERIRKQEMPEPYSIDIDDSFDWYKAEFFLKWIKEKDHWNSYI